MHRVLDLDVLAGPHCGGRLRVLATVQDPVVARTILAHLGRVLSPEPPGPAPPAPASIPWPHRADRMLLRGAPAEIPHSLLDCPPRRGQDRLDPEGSGGRIRCGLTRQVDVPGTGPGSGRVAVPPGSPSTRRGPALMIPMLLVVAGAGSEERIRR